MNHINLANADKLSRTITARRIAQAVDPGTGHRQPQQALDIEPAFSQRDSPVGASSCAGHRGWLSAYRRFAGASRTAGPVPTAGGLVVCGATVAVRAVRRLRRRPAAGSCGTGRGPSRPPGLRAPRGRMRTSDSWNVWKPVPAGTRWPRITFSFRPTRLSTLPARAASVRSAPWWFPGSWRPR